MNGGVSERRKYSGSHRWSSRPGGEGGRDQLTVTLVSVVYLPDERKLLHSR